MKFSFEVPISYLKQFDKVNDYHFILAHMLLKDTYYAKFYKNSKKYKILDNGCAELGKSINTNDLIKLAKDYKVDVLVLPDIWMNGEKTFKESLKAIRYIKNLKCMFVIQGNSINNFIECYEKFEKESYLNNWKTRIIYGIPYLTCAKLYAAYSPTNRDDDVTNSRIRIIQKFMFDDIKRNDYLIHLLGAGFNFSQEISFMKHYKQIRTVDTSTPFVLSSQGIKLDKYGLFDRKLGRAGTLDFYAKFNKSVLNLAIYNAKVLKNFAKL